MKQFGIDSHGDKVGGGSPRSRATLILIQVVVFDAFAWLGALVVTLFLVVARNQAAGEAFAIGCLVTGIMVLVFGVFSLASGGIANDSGRLAWASVPIFRRDEERMPPGGLTTFALALVVAPPLLLAGFILLA